MSRAQDKNLPVYPEKQDENKSFDLIYQQHHVKIRNYFSLKVSPEIAEDLTQQVFIKVLNHLHLFKGESSLFTWIFKIAQNTLKNEYRRKSRSNESYSDLTYLDTHSVPIDFTKHVEIRIDISSALQKIKKLDQHIVLLRFFVDCTLLEVAEIVGMRESAVKNRLYRALAQLRSELKEWGDITMMSIEKMISIINKDGSSVNKDQHHNKVHKDLFNELNSSVDHLKKKYSHIPTKKVIIEIYPDLPSFHQAAGEQDAPNWFMGTYDHNVLKIVSPLNPGPEHTYKSILKSTVHLFTMWLIKEINPNVPKWIRQGIGGYEAKQMSTSFIKDSIFSLVQSQKVPSFQELNNDTWDFETMKGFQFSYTAIEFILTVYGITHLNKFIRNPDGYEEVFNCEESDFHKQWVQYLESQLS